MPEATLDNSDFPSAAKQVRGFFGTKTSEAHIVVRTAPKLPYNLYPAEFSLRNLKERILLNWTITFLVIAIIAAVLGFSGIAGAAAGIAKILFGLFLVLFLISAISRAVQGKRV